MCLRQGIPLRLYKFEQSKSRQHIVIKTGHIRSSPALRKSRTACLRTHMRRSRTAAICAGVLGGEHASCRRVDGCHDASAEGGCAHESQIYWAAQSAEQRSSLAQYNRMNDQSILVDEAGANEALGEQSASVRKDGEIGR